MSCAVGGGSARTRWAVRTFRARLDVASASHGVGRSRKTVIKKWERQFCKGLLGRIYYQGPTGIGDAVEIEARFAAGVCVRHGNQIREAVLREFSAVGQKK
jgi:hypothetical protein